MTAIEQSDLWEKIAGLKLRLVSHTNINRHIYRGQAWYVLHDRASARHYRFDAGAYMFINQLDGTRTVQEAWDRLHQQHADNAPAQHDIVRLVAQLHDAEILQGDVHFDVEALLARRQKQKNIKSRSRWLRPLSIRIPLADPDQFLTALLPIIRPLFSKLSLIIWLLFVIIALLMGVAQYSELINHWSSRALDPQNILAMFLVYPFIKVFHEFGHAAATKKWGGEVHEVGIMFLVFIPNPFVDASASSAFSDKWQRIIVAASGIMVEMFLAALGLLVWLNVSPGFVQDIAFNVMFVGSVSTLLFNGNPLLRFDGYYVLMDAIEIPNLGQRSTRYLAYLVKRYLFKLSEEVSPVTAYGERVWFLFYGIAAFTYRLFISITIALYIAGKFFVIGILLAIWAIVAQVLVPLAKSIGFLLTGVALQGQRIRALSITTIGALLASLFIFVIPIPSWTQAEGILKLPEHSQIRAGSNGFIVQVLAIEGERVKKGDPLFELEDHLLPSRLAVLEWSLKELEVKRTAELMQDLTQAGIYQEGINRVEAELAELRQQMASQIIRSAVDGIFTVSHGRDIQGRFVEKGELLGRVVNHSSITALVVIQQQAVDLVRQYTKSVEVRFPHQPGESVKGSIQREVPLITDRLPSRTLGTQGGGAIAVDARDSSGIQSLEQTYQLDIALPPKSPGAHFGRKVYVRFNHSSETLAQQWFRILRRLFLARFEV